MATTDDKLYEGSSATSDNSLSIFGSASKFLSKAPQVVAVIALLVSIGQFVAWLGTTPTMGVTLRRDVKFLAVDAAPTPATTQPFQICASICQLEMFNPGPGRLDGVAFSFMIDRSPTIGADGKLGPPVGYKIDPLNSASIIYEQVQLTQQTRVRVAFNDGTSARSMAPMAHAGVVMCVVDPGWNPNAMGAELSWGGGYQSHQFLNRLEFHSISWWHWLPGIPTIVFVMILCLASWLYLRQARLGAGLYVRDKLVRERESIEIAATKRIMDLMSTGDSLSVSQMKDLIQKSLHPSRSDIQPPDVD